MTVNVVHLENVFAEAGKTYMLINTFKLHNIEFSFPLLDVHIRATEIIEELKIMPLKKK